MSKNTNNKDIIKKRKVDIANKNQTLINKANRKPIKNESSVMLISYSVLSFKRKSYTERLQKCDRIF